MDEAPELHIPDYVPDELVEQYGTKASARERGPQGLPATTGRSRRRLHGVALACCGALLATILVALVAAAPEPVVAGAGMLVMLLVATVVGTVVARALLRADRDNHS